MENYNIPLGIDTKGVLSGFEAIDEGLAGLTLNAKNATAAITEALGNSAKSGDVLVTKMNAGAAAAKNLQEVARTTGLSLEQALSPDRIKTDAITNKIGVFTAKLKDAVGKPIEFKFNLDEAGFNLLTSKLKDAKGQMEGFQLIIDSAKARLNDFAKGSTPFNQLNKQIQEAEKFLNVLKEDVQEINAEIATPVEPAAIQDIGEAAEQAEPKTQSLRLQLRQMREELAQLELAGQANTDNFRELSIRAGELSDQIGDTSQRIQRLASDTKGLDAGIAAVRGLAGAFAIGQGALAAFGEQSEEAAKAIQKVQGAMAILQGIQEVANVLNKDSALSVYLQTFASNGHTTALAAETVAIEGETVATEAATVATTTWTATLLANPIIAIIAVLVAATYAVYAFAKAQDQAGLSADALNKILARQQQFYDEDIARIDNHNKARLAEAEAARKQQSVLTEIQIGALASRKLADQLDIEEVIRYRSQLNTEDKNYLEAKKAADDKIAALEKDKTNVAYQSLVLQIQLQRQLIDETAKLNLELLKARFANNEAEKAILLEAKAYAADIQAAKIAELRDGQQKEVEVLQLALAQKLSALQSEGDAKLRQLQEQRKELDFDLDTNRKVIAVQKAGLDEQIRLEKQSLQERNELKQTLVEAEAIEELKIIEKYREQQAAFELDIAGKLLAIQKDSAANRLAILVNSSEAEIEQIRAKHLTQENEEIAINAILQKLDKDQADTSLKSSQDQIELDKQINVNRINEAKVFANKSEQVVALKNIAILTEEKSAAIKQLDLLRASGKDETDAEVVNAKARVDAATDAVNEAVRKRPAKSLLSIILPEATPEQLANITANIQQTFTSLGQAVDSYFKLVNDRYEKIIAVKKAAVDADDAALSTLQDQLKTEQDLRDKGYANNVDGINAELAAKTAQRAKDIQDQEDFQKRLAKSQKAQADAQTALQAANLITASTNIYLQATAVGGPIAVPIAIAAIAAMVAAFVLSKAEASKAVQATQFADGGEITGKSHAQGGQKYYAPDGSGGVMELEDGEFVTNKKSTGKYKPLLEVINNNTFDKMSNEKLIELLDGLGVHISEEEHTEALKESRIFSNNQINNVFVSPATPKELVSMNEGIQRMVAQQESKTEVYEDGDYLVKKKGNKTIRVRKK